VSGKGTGFGTEAQIHVVLSASALHQGREQSPEGGEQDGRYCDRGLPVQNGKAGFPLFVTASFQLSGSPPVTVSFTIMVSASTSVRHAFLIGGTHTKRPGTAPLLRPAL
jgi:hypothetical protein